MPKPTTSAAAKYRAVLEQQLRTLTGDVGSMRDEALRASDQDNSVDHLADQGTDNNDQAFMLGLIENEEETIALIREALERMEKGSAVPYGQCLLCREEAEAMKSEGKKGQKGKRGKKIDPWIPKTRLDYVPWARYCVIHQAGVEKNRESA